MENVERCSLTPEFEFRPINILIEFRLKLEQY